MRLREDTRALGLGTLGFFAILTVGALLFILMDPAIAQIVSMSKSQTTNSQATTVIDTRKAIWDAVLFIIIALAGVFIVARSVLESQP